jgi:hypothetical protein
MMNETNEFNQNPVKALDKTKKCTPVKARDGHGHLLL